MHTYLLISNRCLHLLRYLILKVFMILLSCCCAIVPGPNRFFFHKKHLPVVKSSVCALKLNRYAPRFKTYYRPYSHSPWHKPPSLNVCIRYDDVNKALAKAKKRIRYSLPPKWSSEFELQSIDKSANIILETTKILAKQFHLSYREINEELPLIDTWKTDIWDMCPHQFKPTVCTVSRYRSMDGKCNNGKHGVWGMSYTPFVRYIPPVYSNGIDSPRVSCVDGGPLPNPRKISASVHKDFNHPSDQRSILLMSWGQFLDHDLTLAASVRDEYGLEVTCCNLHRDAMNRNCMPIDVPENDPFYSKYNVRCLDFLRILAGQRPGCTLGPRVHINLLTSSIDANFIYGSTEELASELRLGSKGFMKTWDKLRHLGLKDLLPPMTNTPDRDCIARPRQLFCFLAGDERVNEQIHLTVLHTLYVRDHNRIAWELALINPHWDDEKLFQETRHIMAATVQHIAYNEFLPLLLGKEYLRKYNLTLQREGYWHGYDENVHMGPANAFQSAAFRFGHTHIQSKVRLFDKNHNFINSIHLRELLRRPFIVYEPGVIDKLIGGLLNTPAQVYDPFITSEVTNHLFEHPTQHFGLDLVSLNLMRGREHGVAGYNAYREWCGLPRINTFEELELYMSNGTAFEYSKLYKHPDDIDLWSAGVSERVMEGAMIGPTFACIIAYQFSMLRKGDRFWYENPGFPSSFTLAQLQEIRKVTQAKIICENADDIPTIQKWVMRLPHPIRNPRVHCRDLPSINLLRWKEETLHQGQQEHVFRWR